MTLLLLPESSAKQEAPTMLGRKQKSLAVQLVRSFREPYFLSLIIVFVLSFGLANYETVFGLFVDHKFGFTPKDIAMIITFGSIAGAVVQATIFGWILNRFGEKRVITLSLLTAGICILLTLFVHKYWLIFLVTFLVFLSIDILRPAIGTQMSKLAKDQQGYVAGLNSAYTSLGNIAGPLSQVTCLIWTSTSHTSLRRSSSSSASSWPCVPAEPGPLRKLSRMSGNHTLKQHTHSL